MTTAPKRVRRAKIPTATPTPDAPTPDAPTSGTPSPKRTRRAKALLVAAEAAPAVKQPNKKTTAAAKVTAAKVTVAGDYFEKLEKVRGARRSFVNLLHKLGGTSTKTGQAGPFGSADLTLALRHIQDAESRAIRHITGGPID